MPQMIDKTRKKTSQSSLMVPAQLLTWIPEAGNWPWRPTEERQRRLSEEELTEQEEWQLCT